MIFRPLYRKIEGIFLFLCIDCYENLFCESADGTLELSLRSQRALDELRADEPSDLSCTAEILANAPALFENMIAVPKAVGSEGGNE